MVLYGSALYQIDSQFKLPAAVGKGTTIYLLWFQYSNAYLRSIRIYQVLTRSLQDSQIPIGLT